MSAYVIMLKSTLASSLWVVAHYSKSQQAYISVSSCLDIYLITLDRSRLAGHSHYSQALNVGIREKRQTTTKISPSLRILKILIAMVTWYCKYTPSP